MRLLITNTNEVQAYTILRSLRSQAERIVATDGLSSVAPLGYGGMALYSRFLDAKYPVPGFSSDWLAGRLQSDNTVAEETYMQRIEEICRLESVDTIFPSLDPEVYLFSKNKQRLAEQGILAVVPEPEVIRVPMDKAATIRAAQRVGFPCPKTYFPETIEDLELIRQDSKPPWIVKPRFTAHGENMEYVEGPAQLEAAYAKVRALQHAPIVQEYIKGGLRCNYYVTVGRDGQILSMLTPRVVRTHRSGYRVSSKTCISASTAPYVEELRALLADLQLWGGYTIQTQIDPRDATPKLLEINPRLGQHLWWRTGLGVNEPMILLQLARNETPSGNFVFPDNVVLLDPYHDFFFLFGYIVESMFGLIGQLLRGRRDDADGRDSVLLTVRLHVRDYLNRKPKIFCPEVANLLVDPYPCVRAYWVEFRRIMVGFFGRLVSFRRHKVNA